MEMRERTVLVVKVGGREEDEEEVEEEVFLGLELEGREGDDEDEDEKGMWRGVVRRRMWPVFLFFFGLVWVLIVWGGRGGGNYEWNERREKISKQEAKEKKHIPERKAADVKPRVCAMRMEVVVGLPLLDAIFPVVLFPSFFALSSSFLSFSPTLVFLSKSLFGGVGRSGRGAQEIEE